MYFLVFILLSLINKCSSKIYCDAEWCDPSHEPYPNIVSAMTGYNILKGNPFTSQISDPGFTTGYIFLPTYRTNDSTYALHEGVTVRQTLQCSLTTSSDTITNLKGYVDKVKNKTRLGKTFTSNLEFEVKGSAKLGDIGVEASTTIPPLIESAFSSSDEYKDNKDFFTSKKGVLTLQEATCATYTIRISPYDPPPFSTGFKNALLTLNEADFKLRNMDEEELERKRIERFNDFIREFGTHFLEQTTMGARTAITRRYSQDEFIESTQEQLSKCSEDRLKSSIGGVGIGRTNDSCANTDFSLSSTRIAGFERESVTSYGSKPEKDLFTWSKQKFESPLPIKMKLSPIINLFTKKYHKDRIFRYATVLKWFKPLYENYCLNNYQRLGVETCNITNSQKCGLDDTCIPRQQVCLNKPRLLSGYDCCNLQCQSLPCKNGATCIDDLTSCKYKCICGNGFQGDNCDSEIANYDKVRREVEAENDRLSTTTDNSEVAKKIYEKLHTTFKYFYFIVNCYRSVLETNTDAHAIKGNYIRIFQKHGRNVVVGFASTGSQIPNSHQMGKIKSELLHSVTGFNPDADKSLEKAWRDYHSKNTNNFKIVFMQVVQHGNGLRSIGDSQDKIFIEYKTSGFFWKEYTLNLVVMFGNP